MAQVKLDEDPSSSLDQLIGYNLKRAYIRFTDDFKANEALQEISPRKFAALSLVAELPNINQSELARKLGIERSGMVKLIDDLEKEGLIARVAVPGDRRSYALVPTADGQVKLARYRQAVRQHEAALLAKFTASDKDKLLELLQRLQEPI